MKRFFKNSKGIIIVDVNTPEKSIHVNLNGTTTYYPYWGLSEVAYFVSIGACEEISYKEARAHFNNKKGEIKFLEATRQTVNLPRAMKFFLKYRKSDGRIHSYRISAPIDETPECFTVYAFGSGCRSFKRSGVIELRQLA